MRLGKKLLTNPQAPQATGQGGRRARPQAAAPLPSSKRWPKHILKQLASTLEDLLQGCCAQTTGKGSCFVKGTLVDIGTAQKPLGPGWIAGTTRVLTHTANEGGPLAPEQGPPQDHEDRRLIYLVVRAGQPDEVFLTLLRPLQWLKDYRVSEGAIIPLDLPEMAVEGDAFVLKVAPCPTVVEGEGSLVTGTFAHKNGNVLSLKVASEREPLGVTARHWFWSIDRQQWVPAGMLQKGEKLLAKERVTTVEAMEDSDEPLPVYNIEVEGDHVYRVGQSGVLVHNASAGECGKRFKDMASWTQRGNALRSDVLRLHAGWPDNANRDSKTTAVALIQMPDCSWECVYAVSGRRTKKKSDPEEGPFTGADKLPPPSVRERADTLGYRLIRGDGPHAEQKILAALPEGAILLASAACRPACTEETTNRVGGNCRNDLQQRGQQQGVPVMIFDPTGGPPYCT